MKKSIVSLIFILVVCLSLPGCSGEKANPTTDFEFIVNNNNEVEITKYIGTSVDVIIPEKISDKAVVSINKSAFSHCNIKTVKISDSVTNIGVLAFSYCESLTNITIPKSLKRISAQAFLECSSLIQVTIPKNCTLGFEAFRNSGLEEIFFENGIKEISDTCFAGTNIEKLVLPSTIQKIERQAFADCKKLNSISLNEGLLSVGDLAFHNTSITEIVIPSTVKEIKDSSFSKCSKLSKIKFEGDAPTDFLRKLQGQYLKPENTDFTIYYHKNAIGFTTPFWNGYPTTTW